MKAVVGEGVLSMGDHLYLKFTEKFETKFVAQDPYEAPPSLRASTRRGLLDAQDRPAYDAAEAHRRGGRLLVGRVRVALLLGWELARVGPGASRGV